MKIRNISEMINEILCDNILRKFDGNQTFDRSELTEKSFYENLDPDVAVVEDHVNYLILDKTLQERGSSISLTTKGWFILTNADKVGYVAQKIESTERAMNEQETKLLFRWSAMCATFLVVGWLVYRLMFLSV